MKFVSRLWRHREVHKRTVRCYEPYEHIWGCRSFLTPDRFTDAGIGNIEKRGNYREGEHRYYGRLTNVA